MNKHIELAHPASKLVQVVVTMGRIDFSIALDWCLPKHLLLTIRTPRGNGRSWMTAVAISKRTLHCTYWNKGHAVKRICRHMHSQGYSKPQAIVAIRKNLPHLTLAEASALYEDAIK